MLLDLVEDPHCPFGPCHGTGKLTCRCAVFLQVPRIFKAMARAAGLPSNAVDLLSGHSTRVGAAQDMIGAGIEMPAILHAGRWKTAGMVSRYGARLLARQSGAARLARLQGRA